MNGITISEIVKAQIHGLLSEDEARTAIIQLLELAADIHVRAIPLQTA